MALSSMKRIFRLCPLPRKKSPRNRHPLFKRTPHQCYQGFPAIPKRSQRLTKKGIQGLLEGKERTAFSGSGSRAAPPEKRPTGWRMPAHRSHGEKHKKPLQPCKSSRPTSTPRPSRSDGARSIPKASRPTFRRSGWDRFFTKEDKTYRVKKHIRECVVFALQNLAKRPALLSARFDQLQQPAHLHGPPRSR